MLLLEQKSHAAFARLAVDADQRIVVAAQILRIHRQIGHLPVVSGALHRHAFANRILVRSGECREHQIPGTGMTRVDRQLRALLCSACSLLQIGEIQARIHPLAVEIQRERHQVHVTGALAVAEQTTFDALGTGHLCELRGGQLDLAQPRSLCGCTLSTTAQRRCRCRCIHSI